MRTRYISASEITQLISGRLCNKPTKNKKNKASESVYGLFALILSVFSQNVFAEWVDVHDGTASNLIYNDITIDPNAPSTIYASTLNLFELGAAELDPNLLKSTDGGVSWNIIGSGLVFPGGSGFEVTVFDIEVLPGDSNVVFAGTDGGLYKSIDAGHNWVLITSGLPDGRRVIDLIIDPNTPAILYMAINTDGSDATLYDDFEDELFKSTDGGASWFSTGLTVNDTQGPSTSIFRPRERMYRLSIDTLDTDRLYISTTSGILKTVDAAATWEGIDTGVLDPIPNPDLGIINAQIRNVVVDPDTSSTLYIATFGGIHKSTDGGATWSSIGFDDRRVIDIAIDPSDSNKMYASVIRPFGGPNPGFTNGIWRTTDGGASWIPFNVTPPDFVTFTQHISINPSNPSTLYASVVNAGLHTDIGSLLDGLILGGDASFTIMKYTIDNPNGLEFTDLNYVDPNTQITSETMTVINLAAAESISITGGEYSLNGALFTSVAGTVNNGDTVQLRTTSSTIAVTAVDVTVLLASGGGDTWTVITAPDTTPDAFSLVGQSDLATHISVASNTVTITGLGEFDAGVVFVTDGQYSVNGGDYTSSAGLVRNGDTLTVRNTSSVTNNTAVTTNISIGDFSTTFVLTTGDLDTTPNYFNFNSSSDPVNPSQTVTSNSIQVSGINTSVDISVTSGGQYSINGGGFTYAAGTVVSGDSVRLRMSTSSYNVTITSTLTIGNISASFSITTRARDTAPDPYYFNSVINAPLSTGGYGKNITVSGALDPLNYNIYNGVEVIASGTVVNGDVIGVSLSSADTYNTTTSRTLSIGTYSETLSVTTLIDMVPDAFSFADQIDVELNTLVESDLIIMSGLDGLDANSPISIIGGEYSINGGDYTSVDGTVINIDTVSVRTTSSASYDTTVDVEVTIGGISDTFSVTTVSDTVPDAFSFTNQVDVNLSILVTSDTITLTGLGVASPISITGGEYSINGGDFTSVDGTINNDDTVTVRTTSSATGSTEVDVVLTVGGDNGTFTVTTEVDTDGDGIVNSIDINDDNDGYDDAVDNCTLTANEQLDTDGDGYGNDCDADFNGDNMVNSLDLGTFKAEFFNAGVLDTDLNGDGVVNSLDLGVFKQLFLAPPGPSGLNP